jgi:plasmid stabilization system protein ParE
MLDILYTRRALEDLDAIVYRFQPRTNTIVIIDIFHQSVNYPGKV